MADSVSPSALAKVNDWAFQHFSVFDQPIQQVGRAFSPREPDLSDMDIALHSTEASARASTAATLSCDESSDLHKSNATGIDVNDCTFNSAENDAGEDGPGNYGANVQGRPPMLTSTVAEINFILVCSAGQYFFSHLLGNCAVLQDVITEMFDMPASQRVWPNGAYNLANGLGVPLSGALADIYGARILIVASLGWLTIACVLGAALGTRSSIAFMVIRALQGLGVSGMTSSSISYLGRVYKPGKRKTAVFSGMASLAPVGYVVGAIQGGALSKSKTAVAWMFGSNALIIGLIFLAALKYAPTEHTVRQYERLTGAPAVPQRKFDWLGAIVAVAACGLLIFGLTQGSAAHWAPYTYSTIIAAFFMFALFVFIESKVADPLVPNSIWKTKGKSPLMAGLYLIPNAFIGVLATFLVARLFHIMPGHLILGAGCVASALGPIFFLTQHPSTTYWALSFPGIAISTFAPDLSFAAAAIFLTTHCSRRYQGVAGSLLITLQNLSSAIVTSTSESIGTGVEQHNLTVLSVPSEFRFVGNNGTTWMGPGHKMVTGPEPFRVHIIQAHKPFNLRTPCNLVLNVSSNGGLGTTLEDEHGWKFDSKTTPLWSSHLLFSDDNRRVLKECQKNFRAAGADILLTGTYQVSEEGIARTPFLPAPRGVGEEPKSKGFDSTKETVTAALKRGIDSTLQAWLEKPNPTCASHDVGGVALSLGPYGACMVPGQEYSGNYDTAHKTENALFEWHLRRLALFTTDEAESKPLSHLQFIAFETIPVLAEIRA
ncbi:hypothetical protein KEM56_006301, partial [Ascosphaera pollenicola]